MTENNVMEFCQWLVSEKGIEADNLSDYINNNEEEVLKLAQEFKKPKFKVGGKIEAAAEMFKCGGKANKVEKAKDGEKISRKEYKEKKHKRSDVKKAAKQNFGFNNAQFQTAYENAKYGFSNQGLSRRAAKLAAQRALMGNNEYQFNNSLPQIKTNHTIDIDHGLLNRVAEGPKKVFIESIDPVVTNSNYKINTDINWDNIGNDLELHLDPVNYGDKIFDGGQLDEISVIGTPVQKTQRTSGDNIIDFVKNIRFVPIFKSQAQNGSNNNSDNGFRTKTMPGRFGLAHYSCGGKAENKSVKKCQEGDYIVNDKLQNIIDRHEFAKKRVFAKGNTSYDMTVGHDLDFFNDFNGKTDTLIRKSIGFKSPKSYSNEDLGHRFEVAFPEVANFFGYKSGYQKAVDDINSMQGDGVVKAQGVEKIYNRGKLMK